MTGVLPEAASAVPGIHYFLSCSSLNMSYLLLFVHLVQHGGLLTASEIPVHRDQRTNKIFPKSQVTVLGKVWATWKAAFSLAVIGSDSINPSRYLLLVRTNIVYMSDFMSCAGRWLAG